MCADIRGGSPGRGLKLQWSCRVSTTVIYGNLGDNFFGNVTDKTSNITWRYATP